jgi:hypothetical protein
MDGGSVLRGYLGDIPEGTGPLSWLQGGAEVGIGYSHPTNTDSQRGLPRVILVQHADLVPEGEQAGANEYGESVGVLVAGSRGVMGEVVEEEGGESQG